MMLDRRTFFQSAALSGIAAAGAVHAQDAPRQAERFPQFSLEPTGLKITSIETFVVSSNLGFVRLRADDGSEGVGQLAPSDADISAIVLHRRVASHVLGADPADVERLATDAVEQNYKFPWSYVCRAYAGIDTAIWDLLGRREKKSVAQLLGGQPAKLAVYGSSMSRTTSPEAEAARLVKLRDEQGFGAFKVRVGKRLGRDQDQSPGRTEELIPTVRRAVGGDVALLADANSGYTPKRAIEVGRLLEEHDYSHFEEPCPYWQLESTAEVAKALRISVAGGEQDNDLAQWRRMMAMRAVDIVQPDICYVGGLTRALRVARMAADFGLTCVPHSANLSMVSVFTLHLFSVIPNAGRHVEYSIESTEWTKELFSPALQVVEGRVQTPEGPGWGVRVKPELLDKAERKVSSWKD